MILMSCSEVEIKVNLLPPLILALCLSTLRMGAQELFRPDNRLAGSISVVEFTAIKLALSALTALVLAMLCERGTKFQSSWWKALAEDSDDGVLLVLLGGVFILIFQVGREKQNNSEPCLFFSGFRSRFQTDLDLEFKNMFAKLLGMRCC